MPESPAASSMSAYASVRSRLLRAPPVVRWLSRLVVGVGIVALLLARGDPSAVIRVVGAARPRYLIAALAVMLIVLVVSAFRWDAYLRALGLTLSSRDLVRLSFVGAFFNGFLPTGVGGDAYKAIRLQPLQGSLVSPAASVILDRLSGFIGLAVISCIGVAYRLAQGDYGTLVRVAGPLGMAVLLAVATCFAAGDYLTRTRRLGNGEGILGKLRTVLTAITYAGRAPRSAVLGLTLGLVSGGLILVFHWLVAKALDLRVPVGALAAVALLAVVAALAPVTINGIGFREAAYVWGLSAYGIAHDEALAFALLVFSGILATSLVGGLVYAVAGGKVAPAGTDLVSANDLSNDPKLA